MHVDAPTDSDVNDEKNATVTAPGKHDTHHGSRLASHKSAILDSFTAALTKTPERKRTARHGPAGEEEAPLSRYRTDADASASTVGARVSLTESNEADQLHDMVRKTPNRTELFFQSVRHLLRDKNANVTNHVMEQEPCRYKVSERMAELVRELAVELVACARCDEQPVFAASAIAKLALQHMATLVHQDSFLDRNQGGGPSDFRERKEWAIFHVSQAYEEMKKRSRRGDAEMRKGKGDERTREHDKGLPTCRYLLEQVDAREEAEQGNRTRPVEKYVSR
ncbi:hypothetical protein ACEQ8H_008480 [Pleosporales sp. CAS-2024a]